MKCARSLKDVHGTVTPMCLTINKLLHENILGCFVCHVLTFSVIISTSQISDFDAFLPWYLRLCIQKQEIKSLQTNFIFIFHVIFMFFSITEIPI